MAHEMGLAAVLAEIERAMSTKDFERAEALLWPALDQFPALPALWFYAGNVFFAKEINALAVTCYERSVDLEPGSIALANLGAAYRRLNLHDKALAMLQKAAEYQPESASIWTNLAACYVNEGNPDPGIEAAAKALECRPGFARAEWNKGLLHLEKGEFAEGFDLYRSGLGKERLVRNYDSDHVDTPGEKEPPFLTRQNLAEAKDKTVVTWGEQGLGDELMFASIIPELARDVGKVVFECHDRLQRIYLASFDYLVAQGKLVIIPTRKDPSAARALEEGPLHFRAGLGDLAAIYRRRNLDYHQAWSERGPFWKHPDPEEVEACRQNLETLAAGRQIIGLSTRGGVVKTMRNYRTLRIEELEPLFKRDDCMYVCFDYEDVGAYVEHVNREYGEDRLYWFRSIVQHFDYHHTLGLALACDRMVTVCQSVAHLAAGAGIETHVLVPSKPAWRYGLTNTQWFLYPDKNVRLYRQQGTDWGPAMAEVLEVLDKHNTGEQPWREDGTLLRA
jgi:tetratricopeptide (TPR) repeat protein